MNSGFTWCWKRNCSSGLALVLGHPVEPGGVGDVDEQRLAARLRVGAHDRVRRLVHSAVVAVARRRGGGPHGSCSRRRAPSWRSPAAGRASACIAGDSASYAAYWLANIVSPPKGGISRASSIVRHRRLGQVRGVGVPDAAEVDRLVRQLGDRDDLRDGRRSRGRTGTRSARPIRRAKATNWSLSSCLVAEEHHEMVAAMRRGSRRASRRRGRRRDRRRRSRHRAPRRSARR